MLHDDDPPPRRMKPSGKLDQLTEAGSRNRPDLRAGPLLSLPALRTRGQKRRLARDLAIYHARQAGGTIHAIALQFGYSTFAIRESLKRVARLVHPEPEDAEP